MLGSRTRDPNIISDVVNEGYLTGGDAETRRGEPASSGLVTTRSSGEPSDNQCYPQRGSRAASTTRWIGVPAAREACCPVPWSTAMMQGVPMVGYPGSPWDPGYTTMVPTTCYYRSCPRTR